MRPLASQRFRHARCTSNGAPREPNSWPGNDIGAGRQTMKNSLLITLILLVTLATNTSTGYCQQPNPSTASPDTSGPDAHALRIRHQLEHLGFGRDVTLSFPHGHNYILRTVA